MESAPGELYWCFWLLASLFQQHGHTSATAYKVTARQGRTQKKQDHKQLVYMKNIKIPLTSWTQLGSDSWSLPSGGMPGLPFCSLWASLLSPRGDARSIGCAQEHWYVSQVLVQEATAELWGLCRILKQLCP